MSPLAPAYAPLRHAVAHLLLADDLCGILCSFDRLVVPLDTLRNSISNNNVASINHDLLVLAFKSDENEYIIPYSHLGISSEGGGEHYLLVRCAMRFGKSETAYECGRFTKEDGSIAAGAFTMHNMDVPSCRAHDDMPKHPMDQPSMKRILSEIVPKGTKDKLSALLVSRKDTAKSNKRSSNKKSNKRADEKAKKERRKQQREELRDTANKKRKSTNAQQTVPAAVSPVPSASVPSSSVESSSPPIKKRKSSVVSTRIVPKAEAELSR